MVAATGSFILTLHTSPNAEVPSIGEDAGKVDTGAPHELPAIVHMRTNSPRATLGSRPGIRKKAMNAASLPFKAVKALCAYVSYHVMARTIMSGHLDGWLRQIDYGKFPSEIAGLTKSNARHVLADKKLLKRIDALADEDGNPAVRRLFKHLRRDLNTHHGALMQATLDDIGPSQNDNVSSLKGVLDDALRATDIDMQHSAYKKNLRLNLERCTDRLRYADLSNAKAEFDAIGLKFCKTEAYAVLQDALARSCLVKGLSSPAPRPVGTSAEEFVETLCTMRILLDLPPEKILDRQQWQERIQLTTHSLLVQLNLPGDFIGLQPVDKGIALEQRAQEIFEVVAPWCKTEEDMQLLWEVLTDLHSLYFSIKNYNPTLERFYKALGDKIEAWADQQLQMRQASPAMGRTGQVGVYPNVNADPASVSPPPSMSTYRPKGKPVQV
ncbi:hypothetical protein [Bordetella sp. LUAb4]|uniref:hypothetical protein n=1 Tax=Bordetella sp. LUAb4 TaxID=2843195 RepID=UPI001E614016|nr:hypothetical protein [Bordetella sp. LUAb4]